MFRLILKTDDNGVELTFILFCWYIFLEVSDTLLTGELRVSNKTKEC